MPETNEIGPTNNSPKASARRFKERQDFKSSSEGRVISTAKHAEQLNREEAELAKEKLRESPDVVEEKSFIGIPTTKIKRWFRKR